MRVGSSLIRDGTPVDERTEAGLAIGTAIADDLEEFLETRRKTMLISGGAGAGGVVIGLLLLIAGVGGPLGLLLLIGGPVAGGVGIYYAKRREPDVGVRNVQKRYWTGHLVRQNGSTMLVDATDSIERQEFEFERLENPEAFSERVGEFTSEPELPVVMPGDGGVESQVERELETIATELDNRLTTRESVPVFGADAPIVRGIEEITEYADDAVIETESIAVDASQATEAAAAIEELESMAFEDDVGETLQTFKDESEETVSTLTETHELTVELLNHHIDVASDILATTTYNFYCPDCLADDVSSPLVPVDDPTELRWRCETCRGQFTREDDPMPKHRIKDELVEDIWDQLWIEKEDEKRQMYENIEDRKADLEEEEFQQKREEIRDTWNRIKDRRSKIRDLETEADAARASVEKLGEKMAEYNRLREQRKREFQRDVQDAVQRVEQQVQDQLQETRDFEDQQLEQAREQSSKLSGIRRAEEEERHREKQFGLAVLAGDADAAEKHAEELDSAREQRGSIEDELSDDGGITGTIQKMGSYLGLGSGQRRRYE